MSDSKLGVAHRGQVASSSAQGRPRQSHAELEEQVTTLTRQLSEALEQQATTADVLRIICRSTIRQCDRVKTRVSLM
jgi:hypothetical protein